MTTDKVFRPLVGQNNFNLNANDRPGGPVFSTPDFDNYDMLVDSLRVRGPMKDISSGTYYDPNLQKKEDGRFIKGKTLQSNPVSLNLAIENDFTTTVDDKKARKQAYFGASTMELHQHMTKDIEAELVALFTLGPFPIFPTALPNPKIHPEKGPYGTKEILTRTTSNVGDALATTDAYASVFAKDYKQDMLHTYASGLYNDLGLPHLSGSCSSSTNYKLSHLDHLKVNDKTFYRTTGEKIPIEGRRNNSKYSKPADSLFSRAWLKGVPQVHQEQYQLDNDPIEMLSDMNQALSTGEVFFFVCAAYNVTDKTRKMFVDLPLYTGKNRFASLLDEPTAMKTNVQEIDAELEDTRMSKWESRSEIMLPTDAERLPYFLPRDAAVLTRTCKAFKEQTRGSTHSVHDLTLAFESVNWKASPGSAFKTDGTPSFNDNLKTWMNTHVVFTLPQGTSDTLISMTNPFTFLQHVVPNLSETIFEEHANTFKLMMNSNAFKYYCPGSKDTDKSTVDVMDSNLTGEDAEAKLYELAEVLFSLAQFEMRSASAIMDSFCKYILRAHRTERGDQLQEGVLQRSVIHEIIECMPLEIWTKYFDKEGSSFSITYDGITTPVDSVQVLHQQMKLRTTPMAKLQTKKSGREALEGIAYPFRDAQHVENAMLYRHLFNWFNHDSLSAMVQGKDVPTMIAHVRSRFVESYERAIQNAQFVLLTLKLVVYKRLRLVVYRSIRASTSPTLIESSAVAGFIQESNDMYNETHAPGKTELVPSDVRRIHGPASTDRDLQSRVAFFDVDGNQQEVNVTDLVKKGVPSYMANYHRFLHYVAEFKARKTAVEEQSKHLSEAIDETIENLRRLQFMVGSGTLPDHPAELRRDYGSFPTHLIATSIENCLDDGMDTMKLYMKRLHNTIKYSARPHGFYKRLHTPKRKDWDCRKLHDTNRWVELDASLFFNEGRIEHSATNITNANECHVPFTGTQPPSLGNNKEFKSWTNPTHCMTDFGKHVKSKGVRIIVSCCHKRSRFKESFQAADGEGVFEDELMFDGHMETYQPNKDFFSSPQRSVSEWVTHSDPVGDSELFNIPRDDEGEKYRKQRCRPIYSICGENVSAICSTYTNTNTPEDPLYFYNHDIWSGNNWHHLVDHAQTASDGTYSGTWAEEKEFRFLKEDAVDYSKAFDVDGKTVLDYNFIGVNPFHQALRVAALSGEDMKYNDTNRSGTKQQEFGTLRLYSRLEVPFSRQQHDDNFVEGNVSLWNDLKRGHKHPFSLDFPGLEYDLMRYEEGTAARTGPFSNMFTEMKNSLMSSLPMPQYFQGGSDNARIFRLGQNTNPDIPRSPVSKTFKSLASEETPYYDQRYPGCTNIEGSLPARALYLERRILRREQWVRHQIIKLCAEMMNSGKGQVYKDRTESDPRVIRDDLVFSETCIADNNNAGTDGCNMSHVKRRTAILNEFEQEHENRAMGEHLKTHRKVSTYFCEPLRHELSLQRDRARDPKSYMCKKERKKWLEDGKNDLNEDGDLYVFRQPGGAVRVFGQAVFWTGSSHLKEEDWSTEELYKTSMMQEEFWRNKLQIKNWYSNPAYLRCVYPDSLYVMSDALQRMEYLPDPTYKLAEDTACDHSSMWNAVNAVAHQAGMPIYGNVQAPPTGLSWWALKPPSGRSAKFVLPAPHIDLGTRDMSVVQNAAQGIHPESMKLKGVLKSLQEKFEARSGFLSVAVGGDPKAAFKDFHMLGPYDDDIDNEVFLRPLGTMLHNNENEFRFMVTWKDIALLQFTTIPGVTINDTRLSTNFVEVKDSTYRLKKMIPYGVVPFIQRNGPNEGDMMYFVCDYDRIHHFGNTEEELDAFNLEPSRRLHHHEDKDKHYRGDSKMRDVVLAHTHLVAENKEAAISKYRKMKNSRQLRAYEAALNDVPKPDVVDAKRKDDTMSQPITFSTYELPRPSEFTYRRAIHGLVDLPTSTFEYPLFFDTIDDFKTHSEIVTTGLQNIKNYSSSGLQSLNDWRQTNSQTWPYSMVPSAIMETAEAKSNMGEKITELETMMTVKDTLGNHYNQNGRYIDMTYDYAQQVLWVTLWHPLGDQIYEDYSNGILRGTSHPDHYVVHFATFRLHIKKDGTYKVLSYWSTTKGDDFDAFHDDLKYFGVPDEDDLYGTTANLAAPDAGAAAVVDVDVEDELIQDELIRLMSQTLTRSDEASMSDDDIALALSSAEKTFTGPQVSRAVRRASRLADAAEAAAAAGDASAAAVRAGGAKLASGGYADPGKTPSVPKQHGESVPMLDREIDDKHEHNDRFNEDPPTRVIPAPTHSEPLLNLLKNAMKQQIIVRPDRHKRIYKEEDMQKAPPVWIKSDVQKTTHELHEPRTQVERRNAMTDSAARIAGTYYLNASDRVLNKYVVRYVGTEESSFRQASMHAKADESFATTMGETVRAGCTSSMWDSNCIFHHPQYYEPTDKTLIETSPDDATMPPEGEHDIETLKQAMKDTANPSQTHELNNWDQWKKSRSGSNVCKKQKQSFKQGDNFAEYWVSTESDRRNMFYEVMKQFYPNVFGEQEMLCLVPLPPAPIAGAAPTPPAATSAGAASPAATSAVATPPPSTAAAQPYTLQQFMVWFRGWKRNKPRSETSQYNRNRTNGWISEMKSKSVQTFRGLLSRKDGEKLSENNLHKATPFELLQVVLRANPPKLPIGVLNHMTYNRRDMINAYDTEMRRFMPSMLDRQLVGLKSKAGFYTLSNEYPLHESPFLHHLGVFPAYYKVIENIPYIVHGDSGKFPFVQLDSPDAVAAQNKIIDMKKYTRLKKDGNPLMVSIAEGNGQRKLVFTDPINNNKFVSYLVKISSLAAVGDAFNRSLYKPREPLDESTKAELVKDFPKINTVRDGFALNIHTLNNETMDETYEYVETVFQVMAGDIQSVGVIHADEVPSAVGFYMKSSYEGQAYALKIQSKQYGLLSPIFIVAKNDETYDVNLENGSKVGEIKDFVQKENHHHTLELYRVKNERVYTISLQDPVDKRNKAIATTKDLLSACVQEFDLGKHPDEVGVFLDGKERNLYNLVTVAASLNDLVTKSAKNSELEKRHHDIISNAYKFESVVLLKLIIYLNQLLVISMIKNSPPELVNRVKFETKSIISVLRQLQPSKLLKSEELDSLDGMFKKTTKRNQTLLDVYQAFMLLYDPLCAVLQRHDNNHDIFKMDEYLNVPDVPQQVAHAHARMRSIMSRFSRWMQHEEFMKSLLKQIPNPEYSFTMFVWYRTQGGNIRSEQPVSNSTFIRENDVWKKHTYSHIRKIGFTPFFFHLKGQNMFYNGDIVEYADAMWVDGLSNTEQRYAFSIERTQPPGLNKASTFEDRLGDTTNEFTIGDGFIKRGEEGQGYHQGHLGQGFPHMGNMWGNLPSPRSPGGKIPLHRLGGLGGSRRFARGRGATPFGVGSSSRNLGYAFSKL